MKRPIPDWLRIGARIQMDGWTWTITKFSTSKREVYLEYSGTTGPVPSKPLIWCNLDEIIEGPRSGLLRVLEHGGAA